jgi:hypothetical protein
VLKTQEKTIDDRTVKITEFAARRKLLLQVKLVKLVGPAIGAAAGGARGSGLLDSKIGPEAIGAAVQKLADAMDPQSFFQLAMELLQDTWVDGKDIKTDAAFDAAFEHSLVFLYKVLGFSLEVNFSDFFGKGGIGGILQRFAPAPPNASPST